MRETDWHSRIAYTWRALKILRTSAWCRANASVCSISSFTGTGKEPRSLVAVCTMSVTLDAAEYFIRATRHLASGAYNNQRASPICAQMKVNRTKICKIVSFFRASRSAGLPPQNCPFDFVGNRLFASPIAPSRTRSQRFRKCHPLAISGLLRK